MARFVFHVRYWVSTIFRRKSIAYIGIVVIVLLNMTGCEQSHVPEVPEVPPLEPGEVFVDFCIREVDLKERAIIIEQLINEPNVVLVDEKLTVREDAIIIFYTLRGVDSENFGKGQEREEWIGDFAEIKAGQTGGLILDKEGKVRFIDIWFN